ncbi:unnamed protein product, partial [Prorocentrum cordatum]
PRPVVPRAAAGAPRRAGAAPGLRAFCAEAGANPQAAPSEGDLEELSAKAAEARELLSDLAAKRLSCKEDSRQAAKRHETDLVNESKYGITNFAKAMLQIPDNLDRAIGSVKQEDVDQDKELLKLRDGVVQMQKEVRQALDKFGIVKMDAEDKPFNPEQHEAMFAMDMPGKEPNIVFHVMEPGYMIHDRTLRAAKVGVTRGPQ